MNLRSALVELQILDFEFPTRLARSEISVSRRVQAGMAVLSSIISMVSSP